MLRTCTAGLRRLFRHMLIEMMRIWDTAVDYRSDREVEVQRHCRDYTLFMSGLFRSHLERESLLTYYLEQGEQAYRLVAERLEMTLSVDAYTDVLRRLQIR